MSFRKGVTPVVAVVLLLLITVGAVGAFFTLFSSISNQEAEADYQDIADTEIAFQGVVERKNGVNLVIKNTGDEPVNVSFLELYYGEDQVPYRLYKQEHAADSSELLARWEMDGSGQFISDSSGNMVSGLRGSTGGSDPEDPDRISTDCVNGGCLSFDGQNDHVSLSDTPTSENRTRMVWVKLNEKRSGGSDPRQGILSMRTWNSGDLHLHTSNEQRLGFSLNVVGEPNALVEVDPILDKWVNVATVYNTEKGMLKLLVDGDVVGSTRTKEGIVMQPDDVIGDEFTTGRHLNGSVDTVEVYSDALSTTEIKTEIYPEGNCFEDGVMLEPGDTYECTTGVGIPEPGSSLEFRVELRGGRKAWDYLCKGSSWDQVSC